MLLLYKIENIIEIIVEEVVVGMVVAFCAYSKFSSQSHQSFSFIWSDAIWVIMNEAIFFEELQQKITTTVL